MNTFSLNRDIATEIADHYKIGIQRAISTTQDTLSRELLERSLELDGSKLQSILEASFFASFEAEEGRTHDFAVAITPPASAMSQSVVERLPPNVFARTYSFVNQIPIDRLPKVAPAVVVGRQRIGVWFGSDGVKIWGFLGTGTRVDSALQIRTFQPGQLGVFAPLSPTKRVYLISATQAEAISGRLSLAELLFTEEDLNKRRSADHATKLRYCGRIPRWTRLLMDIANRMRKHRHGGTLLVIPGENTADILEDSIKPLEMAPEHSFDYLSEMLVKEEDEGLYAYERNVPNPSLPWSFETEAQMLAQATAVDGATIITKDFRLIGFGAKIEKSSPAVPEQVLINEPFDHNRLPSLKPVSDLGGTRHQSAAQFVFDQRNALAIVASQDGRISVFSWDRRAEVVSVFRHAEYLFAEF